MLLEPLQVRQPAAGVHGVHRAPVVMISVKTPEEGHWATQLPLCRNGVSGDVQLMQLELPGPLHVPHAALQGWQTELPSAYLPIGRHEARHDDLLGTLYIDDLLDDFIRVGLCSTSLAWLDLQDNRRWGEGSGCESRDVGCDGGGHY